MRAHYKNCLLSALLIFISGLATAQQNLKFVSYNIFEGMRKDTTKGKQIFVKWIKEQNPDILALQECNKFTQKSLEELAKSYGHPYAVLLKEPGYPVAITSKFPIVWVNKVTDNMHHGFITARINGLNILVTHFSPHNYAKRREEVQVILSTIHSSGADKNWVLMGDLNSLSPLDRENYSDGKYLHRLIGAAKANPIQQNLIDGKELDFEVQQALLNYGLIDAARQVPTGKKIKSPRIDYIYTSKNLSSAILTADFIRDDFTKSYSDHLPMMMTLKYKQ